MVNNKIFICKVTVENVIANSSLNFESLVYFICVKHFSSDDIQDGLFPGKFEVDFEKEDKKEIYTLSISQCSSDAFHTEGGPVYFNVKDGRMNIDIPVFIDDPTKTKVCLNTNLQDYWLSVDFEFVDIDERKVEIYKQLTKSKKTEKESHVYLVRKIGTIEISRKNFFEIEEKL